MSPKAADIKQRHFAFGTVSNVGNKDVSVTKTALSRDVNMFKTQASATESEVCGEFNFKGTSSQKKLG